MSAKTQGVVVALLAAVLVRLALTGEYLRFVLPWMRWPLLITGLVLLVMAIRPALGLGGSAERVPWATWLLLLPVLIVFAVAPPPLGAYLAERRSAQPPPRPASQSVVRVHHGGGPVDLGLDEFTWGAAQPDDVMGLTGATLRVEGFVSTDHQGGWYLTRLVIFCCAADAVVERIKILGHPAPPRDQWVRVTGVWVAGTGADPATPPEMTATQVVDLPPPKNPYG